VTKRSAPATRSRKISKISPPTKTARTARATKLTARKIAGFAAEKKAVDVLVMDLRKITDVTSFFIVCSGDSTAQVKAIADNVLQKCRHAGMDIYHLEGYDSQRWVLIDLVDVVVHVFLPDVRSYYQLERLWGDAPVERMGDGAVEATPR